MLRHKVLISIMFKLIHKEFKILISNVVNFVSNILYVEHEMNEMIDNGPQNFIYLS